MQREELPAIRGAVILKVPSPATVRAPPGFYQPLWDAVGAGLATDVRSKNEGRLPVCAPRAPNAQSPVPPCELPCWCCGGPDGYDVEIRMADGGILIVFSCLECAKAAKGLVIL